MAATEGSNLDDEKMVSFRTTERLKRQAGMRAQQLGLDTSEYIRQLIREDLEDVDLPEPQ